MKSVYILFSGLVRCLDLLSCHKGGHRRDLRTHIDDLPVAVLDAALAHLALAAGHERGELHGAVGRTHLHHDILEALEHVE